MSETDNIFEFCMAELKKRVEGIEVNADTIIEILKYAMEVVELSKAKGKAQRDLAIKLVRKVIGNDIYISRCTLKKGQNK